MTEQAGLFAPKPRTREEIRAEFLEWMAWRKRQRAEHAGAVEHEREAAAALPGPMAALLAIAVPLWIERLRALPAADFEARRVALVDIMAGNDGALIADGYRRVGAKKGQMTDAFNHLAECLAVLSFSPGGVKWCGMRYDAADGPPPPSPGEIRASLPYRESLRRAAEWAVRMSLYAHGPGATDAI